MKQLKAEENQGNSEKKKEVPGHFVEIIEVYHVKRRLRLIIRIVSISN